MITNSNIAVDTSACLACGRCVDRCIMDNLRLSLPPCRQSCPLDLNCQGILRLAARGNAGEAARELRRNTPFGALLCPVCSAPCETACSRGRLGDEALDIRGVVRSLAARFADILHEVGPCAPASGQSAAVIGAGPAGCQAAFDLRSSGHEVTLFATSTPLAELAGTVPAAVLTRVTAMLTDMGIRIVDTGPQSADAPDVDRLCASFDAVLDCAGLVRESPDELGRVRDKLFTTGGRNKAAGTAALMAMGKRVAHTINNILTGFSPDYESDRRAALGLTRFQGMDADSTAEEAMAATGRVRPSSGELSPEEAGREAGRCLACGRPYEQNQTCWYCLPCEVVCPTQALHVRIPYLIR